MDRRRGATVWITGLPASGKSTVACALEERLAEGGVPCYRLDGDTLRHGLTSDLGFSAEERHENVRRAAHVACMFADAGLVAVCALISPHAAGRAVARQIHDAAVLPFVEVYMSTSLQECERRDPKGLYARARAGELRDFTGVDDPYEPPDHPDIEIDHAVESTGDGVVKILAALDRAAPGS
jgi:bifunctional enzyme CysN/CysC